MVVSGPEQDDKAKRTQASMSSASLRTALFRVIDKVSRLLVRCMLEPPLALVAVRGPRAYAEWAAKSGAAKVSQEMWTRARKLFLRHLEPFPAEVRREWVAIPRLQVNRISNLWSCGRLKDRRHMVRREPYSCLHLT